MRTIIRRKCIVAIVTLAMVVSLLPAITLQVSAASIIYVNSSTGNDTSGDGTSSNPYKTFSKGYSETTDGGTLDLTGTFTWTDADETGDAGSTGFTIDKNITIQGHGAGTTIVQAASSSREDTESRVFTVDSSGSVTFDNLEIRYGYLSDTVTHIGGGGLELTKGAISISNCYIHDNKAAKLGFGIDSTSSDVTLSIDNSVIAYNSRSLPEPVGSPRGGGIYAAGHTTITNSTVNNNSGVNQGAGIYLIGATAFITNCTVAYNSTNDVSSYGGGIYFETSTATVTNCTIAYNSCKTYGGGISLDSSDLTVKNTIIAQNTCINDSTTGDFDNYKGTITDNGYNIIEDYITSGFDGTGDKLGVQAKLGLSGTLADNGGSTETLALQSGSVAINAGEGGVNGSVSVPSTDQRGFGRDGQIDIGAYEYTVSDTTAPSLTAGAVTRTSDTAGTVKFTSNEAGSYYYAVVADGATAPTIDTSGAGTVCTTAETTITDPTGLTAGAKDIYIKVKDAAGNVSDALKIDIAAYVPPDTTAPSLTAGAITRTGDTTGTVKFTSNEAGSYYYAVVADGATAPAIDTSGAGTVCTTAETTITDPTGLTAGAKDIYIKVKDAAGNVSDALKIDIAAYVPPDTTAPSLTAGAITRTGDTTGTVKFTSNEAGSYYYAVVADGATAPAIDTSGAGTVCTTAETTITDPTGLTAGAKDIYIKVKDAAGNVSDALKIDIAAYVPPDTTAPSLTAGAISRTSDTTGTVKFTSNEAGSYYYAVVADGATAPAIDTSGAGTVCTTAETTITDPTGLTAGAKDIYIKVKDAAGNVSDALKIDIAAYVPPDTTAPSLTAGAISRTGDTTGTVKFTSNEAGSYYYAVVADGATAPAIDTSGAGTVCTTAETTITDPTGLTAGAKDIYIKVKDAAGNVSDALKIDIAAYVPPDTTAPSLTAGAISRTGDTTGTVKFTSNEAGSYYYAVVADGATAPAIDTSGAGTVCTTAETTITDPTGLTAGAKDIYIKVKDAAGNVSDALKIDIAAYVPPDTTAPSLTAGAITRTGDTTGTVKFTSNEAGSYYYTVVADGATAPAIDTSGAGTVCTTAETTITDPTGLTAGAKDIYIKVKDAAGNVSDALKIDIAAYVPPDTTAPSLTAGAVTRTSDTAGTVKFTSNEAGSYYYAVVADGATAPAIDTSGAGTVCTTAETTITDPTGLTAGAKDIYIKVKDAAGNVSDALKIDIAAYVPPDTTAPSLTAGAITRTGDTTGTVKFTSNEAGSYYYTVVADGATAPAIDTSGAGTVCTTAETTITDPTGLTAGAKDIYIKVKDAAGNVSDALKIDIAAYVPPDTTAPSLTAGAISRTGDTTGTVKFTSNEAGSYYYAVVADGATAPAIDTSGAGTVCTTAETTITDPTGLTAGAKDIYIKVKDAAGNVSDALKIDIAAYPSSSGGGSSSKGSSGGKSTTQSQEPATVTVNGKEQDAGKESTTTENGKTTVTVTVDSKAIESKINEVIKNNTNAIDNIIQVSVSDTESEVAKVELTGDIVKKLETESFDVSVKRDNVEYVIPAEEFTISKVAQNLGVAEKDLADIKVEVKITKLDEAVIEKYNEVAKANGAELVFPPISFEVVTKTTKANGETGEVKISKFSNFVERVMEIPAGIDPSKITTGIVFNSDGTYSHVPTTIYQKDGKWYASLNSLTNSNYSVVWNPITVKSVENHWAKDAVNDMASRLVIFDPEKFEPNKAITRSDFAEYIVRALGLHREDSTYESKFKDVSSTGERTLAILIANEYGIVSGYTDGTFRGDNQITREEAMAMYQRAMNVTKLTGSDTLRYQNFSDFENVSNWAETYVKEVLSAHVFNGTTAATISPKSNLTYAEAAQAVKNLLVESKLINK